MLEKYVFWNNYRNRYHKLTIDNQKNFQYRLINQLIIPALIISITEMHNLHTQKLIIIYSYVLTYVYVHSHIIIIHNYNYKCIVYMHDINIYAFIIPIIKIIQPCALLFTYTCILNNYKHKYIHA